ncbi:phage tail protein [Clostridium perfringens]|uniref:phage tail protein n=1 Tax=Clostridium perfringens TaxID=1502 RepID=UPI001EDCF0A7|nr:phage tail spike protein [Clostridium perfringens]MCG4540973.1 phage tail protein [Clostridium perfringens]
MELLQLYDKNKKKIAALTEYENLCIESILESGDKTLSFYYSLFYKFYDEIEEETYIRTKTDEYVVKAKGGDSNDNKTLFTCKLNVEELEGTIFDRFESVEQNLVDALNLAIVGTGWRLNSDNCNNRKKRTIRMTNCSSWTIIQKAKKLYDIEFKFDTLNKIIMLFDKIGDDRGIYFIDSLNLRALQVQGNSYGFYTRIIPTGKEGLTIASVNGGKTYLENKQYSNKTLTYYWKDERYTKPESLKEDALEKLNIMSKPFKSYIASTINLAKMNGKYKDILDYNLGDYIYLISKKNKVKDKHRIVKTKEYPQDHSKDTVELANKALDLSEEKLLVDEMSNTLENITTDNGTVDGSTIDSITTKQIENFEANVIKVAKLKAILAEIENLHVNKADIQNLNAVIARIGTLEATKASITELNAIHAIIQQIKAGKADIADLNAAVAKVGILENKTAVLENTLAGNLTAENFKANSIVAGSGIIANGAIGDAEISSLSGNKLRFGTIDTGLVTVSGPNGRLKILGNKLQIFDDVNNKLFERIMLGINDKNRACLTLRATDGQTVLLTEEGLTKAGITDGFGKADDNSLSALKLDKNSIVRQVNGATETIAGTRIQVGDRTLDVELSTQKNTITEHSKELSSQKASLTALDNALKFKVDSQTFTQSTTTINNNINRAKEEAINTANSNTTNAINNMEVGAENLLDDSEKERTNYPNVRGEYLSVNITDIIKSNLGKQIVLSGEIKTLGKEGNINIYSLGKYQFNNSKTVKCTTKEFIPFELVITPTYNPTGDNGEVCNWSFYGVYGSGIYPCIRKLKVSLGNKKSSWSPSANDLKKYSDDVAKAKADLAQANAIANADGKITEEERKRIQQAQENLNTAISKADKAKQDAINEANRVAELKKQEAINSANSHADSKANEALNNAKAFVNADITTVNTHLNKATAEINVLKEKIESKVSQSDIDKSIQEIKIGGRNLALNSSRFELPARNTGTASDNYNYISIDANLLLNSEYTISANVEIVSGSIKEISIYDYPGGKCSRVPIINNRITYTFTKRSNTVNSVLLYAGLAGETRGNSVIFTNVMLEKGNMVSDWSPAPEDTDKLIIDNIKTVTDKITTVESKFTQENNSIKASVQDLNSTTQSITTNVSNINRDLTSKINSNLNAAKSFATDIATNKANTAKQEAISSANSHADSIAASKANEALNNSKAYTNEQINTVNTKVHNVESNLSILSDKISTKVSQSDIDKSIKEIELGGRNLILKSDVELEGTSPKDIQVGKLSDTQFITGKTVTVSLDLECEDLNGGNRVGYEMALAFEDGSTQYIGCWYYVGSSPKTFNGRISSVWNVKKGRIINIHYSGLYIQCSGKKIKIGRPKIELGNKATDWTPAPEDFNVLVADNIKVVNSKISDVSSSVTQLRDSVTTQINSINSKTHSIETNLGGKASKQEVTEVNNRVTTIKASLDGITQRVSATESKTQTLESNLNGKASKQEVNNVSSKVVSLEANLNGITNRVSSTETVTKSLNDKLWEATNKLNNVEQRITPTSIINTVSSAYYKKGEVDNVFSTKSQVEQLDNRINYRFSNTGYSNLIFNGNFANGTVHWRNWGNCSLVAENGQLTVRAKQSSNNANIGAVSSTFVLEKGKKYSLTFQGCSSWNIPWLNYIYLLGEDGVNYRLDLRIDINSADLVYRTATFTAPATKWVRLLIGVEGYLQTDISGFKLVDVCLVEGDIPRRFVPNANEISEGATSIDSNGVIVRHTNGSYTSMTLGGFAWKTKNMEKAYHCLAETGWVNISTGAWLGDHYDIKITLPEYFRGKVFTPCSMIQGWYVESNFSLNQLVVNIPYETINYSEGSFVIRVKALTRDGVFQRNINISWLAIA